MGTRLLMGGLWMALAAAAGCHPPEDASSPAQVASPAAPSFVSLPPTWLTICGRTSLTTPGESTQLAAVATFLDGSRQDLSDRVGWRACGDEVNGGHPGCPYKVVTVDGAGALRAMAFGRTNIVVVYPRGSQCGAAGTVCGWTPFRVVPDGAAVLSGHVIVDRAGHPGVSLELETPSATLRTVTNAAGAFMFAPVRGEVRLHAWHEGLGEARRALQISSDLDIDLELTSEVASPLRPPR
jgi:hypothetical protein